MEPSKLNQKSQSNPLHNPLDAAWRCKFIRKFVILTRPNCTFEFFLSRPYFSAYIFSTSRKTHTQIYTLNETQKKKRSRRQRYKKIFFHTIFIIFLLGSFNWIFSLKTFVHQIFLFSLTDTSVHCLSESV